MYKLFVLFLLSSVFSVSLVSAAPRCGKGQYFTGKKYSANNYQCKPCPNGYYQSNGWHLEKKCKAVKPGYKANKSSGATWQNECPAGKFSKGKCSTCATCPAGSVCPNKKMGAPKKCAPGTYMPKSGSKSKKCYECPAGKFSSSWGSASCCDCCRGFYQDKRAATKCKICPVGKRAGGKAANSIHACKTGNPLLACLKCEQHGNKCPKTDGPGIPVSQAPHHYKRDNVRCGKGYKRCGLLHGRGGFDCVDVANDVESCGGCIDFANKPDSGKDCTAIEGAGNVQCVQGKCVVHSCKPGFAMNADGVCEPALVA